MAKQRRPARRPQIDGKTMRSIHRWDVVGRTIGKIVSPSFAWPVAVIFSAYFLAGKETIVDLKNLSISFFGIEVAAWDMVLISACSIIFGVGAILWARYKMKECQENVAYLTGRNATLESQKDPDRQSSMLEPTGETRKEDIR